ncbi:MAG: hypothetical protein AAGC54_19615 [Cyanobacteria bacterium P01_F01_bin.4]
MKLLTRRLLKTLGFSWLAFLLTGLLIRGLWATPKMTVLIDRSYCPAHQWQLVSQTYAELYRQHQRQQLRLQAVILFSHLGQEDFSSPPPPEMIQNLTTYGQFDEQRRATLQKTYPNAKLLSCYR